MEGVSMMAQACRCLYPFTSFSRFLTRRKSSSPVVVMAALFDDHIVSTREALEFVCQEKRGRGEDEICTHLIR